MKRAKRPGCVSGEGHPFLLRRLLAVLAILGSTVLIGFHGGTAAYLLFWASWSVPLFAWLNRRILAERLRVGFRVLDHSPLRGDRARCVLRMANESALPIPEIRIRLTEGRERFADTPREFVCSLAPGEVKELPLTLECLHCGSDNVGAEEIRIQDLFALSERRLSGTDRVSVLPRTRHARDLAVAPPQEAERRQTRRSYLGESMPDGQLRPYVPGEDVRRIHWKVSQLQGRPILRNTVPEPKSEVVLLPDSRPALPEGEPGWHAGDGVVEGSLFIADYFLRQGIPLRVLPDEARALGVTQPSDFPRLYDLCASGFFKGQLRPDELLERELARGGIADSYILLTWELDEDAIRRLSGCIDLGARVIVVYFGDAAEAGSLVRVDRRIGFFRVPTRSDVFSVLGGGAEQEGGL